MPSPFEIASAIVPSGENQFTGEIPPGWDQGRAAFGGLVLGLLVRAMEATNPDKNRVFRTLIGDICGPILPGQVTLTTRINRKGNSQSNLEVHLEQAGEILALGSAVFGAPRKAAMPDFPIEVPAPPPDWRTLEPLPVRPPHGPPFGRHLEFRTLAGLPFMGAEKPDVAGFIRHKGQERALDAPDLIGLLDAHWPGVSAMPPGLRATATVSFAGQVFCDPATLDFQEPLFYRSKIAAHYGGYFLELRELWHNGVPVAMNQQTLAMIK